MHMGHYAAVNIHQQMLHQRTGTVPKFVELSDFSPMIGLAIGKKAVCYDPTAGTTFGEEPMEVMFGDDLGNTSMTILAYLSLKNR